MAGPIRRVRGPRRNRRNHEQAMEAAAGPSHQLDLEFEQEDIINFTPFAADPRLTLEQRADIVFNHNNGLLNFRQESSGVWKYMWLAECKTYATCQLCFKKYVYNGGTKNLSNHLKGSAHKLDIPSIRMIGSAGAGGDGPRRRNAQFQMTAEDMWNADCALVRKHLADNIPFHQATTPANVEYHKVIAPHYDLPSDTKMNEIVQQMYPELKAKLIKDLKDCPVAITSDGWSSFSTKYLSATVHYIKDDQLHNGLLCCRQQSSQTAPNVTTFLTGVCAEFQIDIPKQLMCVTTDNAANMLAAQRLIGAKYSIGCYAHQLNLAAKEGEIWIEGVLKKVKAIVEYCRDVPTAKDALEAKQIAAGTQPLKLLQSCETRWLSTLKMLQRVNELRHHVAAVLTESKKVDIVLVDEELKVINDVINALKPVNEAITVIQEEAKSAAGKAYTLTSGLLIRERMEKIEANCLSVDGRLFTDSVHAALRNRLNNYLNEDQFKLACILDPRFKHHGFRDAAIKGSAITLLTTTLTQSMKDAGALVEPPFTEYHDPNSLLAYINEAAPQTEVQLEPEMAVSKYLNQFPLQKGTENPLDFWRNYPDPHLKTLAHRYLVLSPTSVPSERLFSDAGELVTDKTNRLLPENIDKRLFLKKNKYLHDR